MENSDYSTESLDSAHSDSIVVISDHDLKDSLTLETYHFIDSGPSDKEDYLSHKDIESVSNADSFKKQAKHIEQESVEETQARHKATEPAVESKKSPIASKPLVERKETPKANQPIAERKESSESTEPFVKKKELPNKTETTVQIKPPIKFPKPRQKKEPVGFNLASPEPKIAPRKARKEPYIHCKEDHSFPELPRLEEKMSKMDLGGLYETVWRKTVNWNNQFEVLAELKDEVENYEPLGELQTGDFSFPHVNILLFGGIGAGKSSVFNTFNSVFRGKIFNVARSGNAEHSLTTKFTKYKIMSGSSTHPQPLKFKICDLRGLEPDHLMTRENMRYILEGHIPDKFGFDPSGNISQDMPGFHKYPKLEDRMHCVCLVQDASVVDAMQDLCPDVTKNIKDMQVVINSFDIPQVVVLTKIDTICTETKRDVGNVFRSPTVEKHVTKVSEVLGLPRNAIYPMKNYETEYQLDPAVDILALLTLKGILTNCDAHLFNHYDEIVKSYPCRERH